MVFAKLGSTRSVSDAVRLIHPLLFRRDWTIICRITTTIIAPTPLVAANFIILGRIISRLGSRYSRLSPKWCTWPQIHWLIQTLDVDLDVSIDTIVFCSCDMISLIVQAVGGASASIAAQNNKNADTVRFFKYSTGLLSILILEFRVVTLCLVA